MFSPEAVLKNFSCDSKITEDHTWTITTESGGIKKTILSINSKDSNQAIILHVIFFIMRGTAVEKAMKKIEPQWVEPLNFIFLAYGTTNPPKGAKLGRDTPTVSRIASCFPPHCMLGIGKRYIKADTIEYLCGHRVPKHVLTNLFVGMLPEGPECIKSTIVEFIISSWT